MFGPPAGDGRIVILIALPRLECSAGSCSGILAGLLDAETIEG
jgi:hypothetical protein